MRDIKFHGKRVDTGEWVNGGYVKYEHMGVVKHIIIKDWAQVYANSYDVDPSTIGQFTGLHDKNRREIWEGDIVRVVELTDTEISVYETDIKWEDCGFVLKSGGKDYDTFLAAWAGNPLTTHPMFQLEVIASVHDNPELIERED